MSSVLYYQYLVCGIDESPRLLFFLPPLTKDELPNKYVPNYFHGSDNIMNIRMNKQKTSTVGIGMRREMQRQP